MITMMIIINKKNNHHNNNNNNNNNNNDDILLFLFGFGRESAVGNPKQDFEIRFLLSTFPRHQKGLRLPPCPNGGTQFFGASFWRSPRCSFCCRGDSLINNQYLTVDITKKSSWETSPVPLLVPKGKNNTLMLILTSILILILSYYYQ